MNLSLVDYLKLKNMEPGSEEAVDMGCLCRQKIGKESEQKLIKIDPYCPYHWHIAVQVQSREIMDKLSDTDKFNSALKFGYFILAAGLAAIVLYKF